MMNIRTALLTTGIAAFTLVGCQHAPQKQASAASATTDAPSSGLLVTQSPHSMDVTVEKMTAALEKRPVKVFNHINHSKGAASISQTLRPTQLFIFGNPKGGTPLMQCAQSVAIDLPLKALVWEDAQGQVMVAVNDMAYLANRHGMNDCPAAGKVAGMLDGLVKEVTSP